LDLLRVADEFLMPDLSKECELVLIANINDDSVIPMLEIADRHQAPLLKKHCIKYILESRNNTRHTFDNLSKDLLAEVLCEATSRLQIGLFE